MSDILVGLVGLAEADTEVLFIDEDLADQVWELWNIGMIPDGLAAMAWYILATAESESPSGTIHALRQMRCPL